MIIEPRPDDVPSPEGGSAIAVATAGAIDAVSCIPGVAETSLMRSASYDRPTV
jgi:hypothetical protein